MTIHAQVLEIQTHIFPRVDLRLRPDPWNVRVATSLGRNESRFGNQQSPRRACALRVILDGHIRVYVLVVRTESCEGRENDAVLELGGANFDRLEERGRRL